MMSTTDAMGRLDKFDRIEFVEAPTPLIEVSLPELGRRGLRLFLKREDLGPLGGGGNKLRKLEVALASARNAGVDTVVTFGALQSNHARLTAAAAAKLGLRCELILSERVTGQGPSYEISGNLLLAELFGATIHRLDAGLDVLAYSEQLSLRLRDSGRNVRIIPFGGSDRDGAIGIARVAVEIHKQLGAQEISPGSIITASGSGSTQAGLVVGSAMSSATTTVVGVSILHRSPNLREIVAPLCAQAFQALGIAGNHPRLECDDRFVGAGYGLTYDAMLETIAHFARQTGTLLDPVYTGKAMHCLLARIAEGRHDNDGTIVFVHTGGIPGVFAYAEAFNTILRDKELAS
ncbi:D-cysteine desulfhydrase family protein [Arvimicrobium flavum]|uniref:D-cysteine desulfhydrase family protein n=1 Tax=Arvimicrobium flavum TaxID=3393320 RepID=UPI00237C1D96|nr:D-cysteine desulfhydrase family protein [Mesorhizobium shangrilense]